MRKLLEVFADPEVIGLVFLLKLHSTGEIQIEIQIEMNVWGKRDPWWWLDSEEKRFMKYRVQCHYHWIFCESAAL